MNKLTESEQKILNGLVASNDHYRRGIRDFQFLQAINESSITELLRKRDITTAKVDGRIINLRKWDNGDYTVRIDKHPRNR